jgi:hypothetical protein
MLLSLHTLCSCMVRIKFTAHPRTPVVLPRFASMVLEDAPAVSTEHRESSAE